MSDVKEMILAGKTALGIELGSTRIKAILIGEDNTPVSVMETAGEGGAWGIALLASYRKNKAEGESLADYLNSKIFAGQEGSTVSPDAEDAEGFEVFIKRYAEGLPIERAAVDHLK